MNNDSTPPPPKPGPAPGQARIRGKITGIEEPAVGRSYTIITFYITGIDAYGPSTPPLAVRDSVRVKATKSIRRNEEISFGNIVTAIISYQQPLSGNADAPRWSLVQLD